MLEADLAAKYQTFVREHKVPMWDFVRQTRDLKDLKLGASPRALIHLYKACKAKALVEGRDYVIPDDVKHLIEPVLEWTVAVDE